MLRRAHDTPDRRPRRLGRLLTRWAGQGRAGEVIPLNLARVFSSA